MVEMSSHKRIIGIMWIVAGACLSTDKAAVSISVEVESGAEASVAVDGDVNTHSCTDDNDAFPWWTVDLAADYNVGKVSVTLPAINGDNCNYHQSCLSHELISLLHRPRLWQKI